MRGGPSSSCSRWVAERFGRHSVPPLGGRSRVRMWSVSTIAPYPLTFRRFLQHARQGFTDWALVIHRSSPDRPSLRSWSSISPRPHMSEATSPIAPWMGPVVGGCAKMSDPSGVIRLLNVIDKPQRSTNDWRTGGISCWLVMAARWAGSFTAFPSAVFSLQRAAPKRGTAKSPERIGPGS